MQIVSYYSLPMSFTLGIIPPFYQWKTRCLSVYFEHILLVKSLSKWHWFTAILINLSSRKPWFRFLYVSRSSFKNIFSVRLICQLRMCHCYFIIFRRKVTRIFCFTAAFNFTYLVFPYFYKIDIKNAIMWFSEIYLCGKC